ncbi:MAG: DUF4382 domain-containing protein [Balneolaceae bacterium]
MKFFLNKYRLLSLIAVIAATLTFTACDSNNGTGTLKVSLTDAPANYEEVNIEIRQVLVNQNENAEEPDENGEEENGWHAIMEDSITVNLLDYQNGGVLALGETELETGRYNQIRLLLGENNNVVIDGETYALTTPSAQQTGYKLNVQADIEEGQVYDLVIDFDASQSIVVTGNGNFILKPVLRTVNLEQQASIAGTVLPLEAEPYVYAIIGEDTLGTQTDDEGDFKLTGLDEGTYDVWFNPINDNYADSLLEGIDLETGENFEFEEAIELESEGLLD